MITALERQTCRHSPCFAAHHFNRFSTGVEKFESSKVLKGSHFLLRRLRRGAILCQLFCPPPRYGADPTCVRTSRALSKSFRRISFRETPRRPSGRFPKTSSASRAKYFFRSDAAVIFIF